MANGQLNLGKQSGGVLSISFPDGATNTEVVLPESGNVVSIDDNSVTDNAIARYDGTTGKLQDSGVIIDDNGNIGIGTSSLNSYTNYTTVTQNGINGVEYDFNVGGNLAGYIELAPTLFKLYAEGNRYFEFSANGAERMRINASGNVGIGTTIDNGVDKLQVNGSISSGQIPQISTGDLNDYKTRTQVLGTYPSDYVSNIPINDHGYLEVIVYSSGAYVMQRFTTLGVVGAPGRVFVRCLVNGTWSSWVEK